MICRSCFRRAATLSRQSISPKAPIRRNFSTIAPRQAAAAPATDVNHSEDPAKAPRSVCVEGTVLNGINYFKGKTDPVALKDDEYPEWLWSCLDLKKTADAAEDADAGDEWCMLDSTFLTSLNPPLFIVRLFCVFHDMLDLGLTRSRLTYTAKSKKQRRLAAKRQRALEAKILASGDLSALAPKVPLQQQTINLPGSPGGTPEEAFVAAGKREELRKAMRKERKAKIKEDNYLKSM